MTTKIQRWGNSQGLRLNKELLSQAAIKVGDEVAITVEHGAIIVTPVQRIRGRYDLSELVKAIPADYKPEELDWGAPAAGEEW